MPSAGVDIDKHRAYNREYMRALRKEPWYKERHTRYERERRARRKAEKEQANAIG